MQDNLKDHIESNREDFEAHEFNIEAGWGQLSPRLAKERKLSIWKRYYMSGVAACLLLVTGSLAFYLGHNQGVSTHMNEWMEAQSYYQQEIDMKLSLVKTKVNDPYLIADLENMDEAFGELKADLKDNVDNSEVIQAMMDNYRLKLKILERILNEISEDEKGNDHSEVRL